MRIFKIDQIKIFSEIDRMQNILNFELNNADLVAIFANLVAICNC